MNAFIATAHYEYTQYLRTAQRLRGVIGLELGDGTAQIQKIIISRELLGKEYMPYSFSISNARRKGDKSILYIPPCVYLSNSLLETMVHT